VQGWPDDGSVKLLVSMTGKPYASNVAIARARAAQQLLFLQPANAREVAERADLARLPPLRLGLEMPPGRGLFLRRRVPTAVQVFAPRAD